MSPLRGCPFCKGEVDWCKNDKDLHAANDDCHYIICERCGSFDLNFPNSLEDWDIIYSCITDEWNYRKE